MKGLVFSSWVGGRVSGLGYKLDVLPRSWLSARQYLLDWLAKRGVETAGRSLCSIPHEFAAPPDRQQAGDVE